ncbi:MAG: hypothetical protein ABI977_21695 [Acidobacteriota bacterium]
MSNHASIRFNFPISVLRFHISIAPSGHRAFVQVCLLALLVGTLCDPAMAAIKDLLRYQSGVRNSVELALNAKQIEILLKSLREKTGFLEMHFDETGFLKLGDRTKPAGGSATARELLIAAVDRTHAIDLENHDRSSRIAFAQLAKSLVYMSRATGAQIEVYPIEIDFSDFAHLRGDKAVLVAFDIGFVVLHEFAHAALGLRDSPGETGDPGECEEYINRIRRELDLPERQNYVARTYRKKIFPGEKLLPQAELLFARTFEQQGRAKTQTFNLTWDSEPVGAVRSADFKPSSAAANNRKSTSSATAASAP